MARLNHNKKRNVGLVYELLSLEVGRALIENGPGRAQATRRAADAMDLIARHMGPGTALEEELSLHRGIMEARGASPRLARRIVDELRAAGIRLASRSSGREAAKTGMIHEINRRLGAETFSQWVPDYTAHASIGIMLSRGLGGRLDEGVELARVEEHLVAYLSSKPGQAPSVNPDATVHTYQTALRIFEEEYGTELTPDQAALLRENVRVALGGPVEPLQRLFDKQKARLKESLRSASSDPVFKEDKDMQSQLSEAVSEVDTVPLTDEGVERLMLLHNLLREIKTP